MCFNPVNVGRDSYKNSRVVWSCAFDRTPACHSNENGLVLIVSANKRPARIASTGAFFTFKKAGAKHSGFDQIARMFCSIAFFVRENLQAIFNMLICQNTICLRQNGKNYTCMQYRSLPASRLLGAHLALQAQFCHSHLVYREDPSQPPSIWCQAQADLLHLEGRRHHCYELQGQSRRCC